MLINSEQPIICIVGLGYVGLPLAMEFSRHFKVIGFDTNTKLVKKQNFPNTNKHFVITDNPQQIKQADFVIITVPTPITGSKEPDLSHIENASRIVSQNMKEDCTVILESTVYPGVTEEIMKPILEESGLKCGQGFKIAYSPERINPGDSEHTIDKIIKIVSGMDEDTSELVAELYSKICCKVFKAKNIKTAEAAKVIENVQRDLNIALMNELSLIFDRMGLSIKDVLEAAATKWNFHRYSPGLVGGHCIPVDPYYLVYKAKGLGYNPQVIQAGRAINDSMPKHVAGITVNALKDIEKVMKGSKVLIMGLTYKENVADTRETPVKGIINELKKYGIKIYGYDPFLSKEDVSKKLNIEFIDSLDFLEGITFDAIVITVAHDDFQEISLTDLVRMQNANPILIDVRGIYDGEEAKQAGFLYRTL